MCDQRAGAILASSFVAGIVCAAALTAPSLWEPAPEPYFGLDDAAADPAAAVAAPPPAAPASAAAASVRRQAVGDFAHMETALRFMPPERLALADATGPIAVAVASQAIPTAGTETHATVEHAAPATVGARPAGDEPPRLPEPVVTAPDRPEADVPADALKELVVRVRQARATRPRPPQPDFSPPPSGPAGPAALPAPLPGDVWTDPDEANWSDGPTATDPAGQPPDAAASGRRRGFFSDRRAEPRGGRMIDLIRGDRRLARGLAGSTAAVEPAARDAPPEIGRWPPPARLIAQLDHLATAAPPVSAWATSTLDALRAVLGTAGPGDANAVPALTALEDAVQPGMDAGDAANDPAISSLTRRAALAVARRVATWRMASALCSEIASRPGEPPESDLGARLAAGQTAAEMARLLGALERFELSSSPADALDVTAVMRAIAATGHAQAHALGKAVSDHYLAPNVRVAVHQRFVERMLPEATVSTSPMQDFVLGRQVRGTSTVERSTSVSFVPDADAIRFELLVRGEVNSRTVTDAGPAAIHSRGAASFTVRKPVMLSPRGLAFGTALGTASNQSQLAEIQTSFDAVPIMGPLVRTIVRNQHDDHKQQATREVNEKIVTRACGEVDRQTEPKLAEMAERIRERIWTPMVALGLDPTPVQLDTTDTVATVRLRLAAETQLAAHTPRPRAPAEAMLSMQVHESTVNNGCERLDLAGRRFALEDLIRLVCGKIGIEPRIPDDLPEGVEVTFAAFQPIRVECRDGQVRVRVSLDALESGRRNWYDIVAEVSYKPTASGPQVLLEREGTVHLGGRGHQGRLEIPLRTIFSKIFPKERPIALLPAKIAQNPRLADLHAVQALSTDGWFALALDARSEASAATSPTATLPAPQLRGPRRR